VSYLTRTGPRFFR